MSLHSMNVSRLIGEFARAVDRTSTPIYAAKSLVVGQSSASWALGYCGERVANERQSVATRR